MNIKNLIVNNHIQTNTLSKNDSKILLIKYKKIIQETQNNINNSKKTEYVLNKNYKFNFSFKDLKNFKKFKTIVLIGMGGSILGTEAVIELLRNKIKKNIFFLNNINTEKIEKLKKSTKLQKTLFIIISKSGNTIETLSNFFSLNILKKNSKNILIISEKKNNLLFSLSKRMNLSHIEHKENIGGRYSVLSEVGIIPSYLCGINTTRLRKHLDSSLYGKNSIFLKDSCIKLANLLIKNKYRNLIFINYEPRLEKFLFWCQQLIAESLGKKGKGFLPVISNAPKDHHSLLQLYLDGPKDKLFYVFSPVILKNSNKINSKKFTSGLDFVNKKSLIQIKNSQKKAMIMALKKNKIPFREFNLKKIQEETLGSLISYFILETIIVGKLAGINPYDQPAVEQVKKFTKLILS